MLPNAYIQDILDQPSILRRLIEQFYPDSLSGLLARLLSGEFDRIILTGMGASHSAAYPSWLRLCQLPAPVFWLPASELLHNALPQITPRTLLWLNSQSGYSIEIVRLLERVSMCRPACVLAFVNDADSTLARQADIVIPIAAGNEATVSTKTFVNMLAANLLAATLICQGDIHATLASLGETAESMASYLANWETQTQFTTALATKFGNAFLIGRGSSMAAAWYSSLILKEAAKTALEAMTSADFRHGPVELADPDLTVFLFAGTSSVKELNMNLGHQIASYGCQVFWVADQAHPSPAVHNLLIPQGDQAVQPLLEILPLQLLSVSLAERRGLQPGVFRHTQKITLVE